MGEIWLVFRRADINCDPTLIASCENKEAAMAFVLWMESKSSEFIVEWLSFRDETAMLKFIKGEEFYWSEYLIGRSELYSLTDIAALPAYADD